MKNTAFRLLLLGIAAWMNLGLMSASRADELWSTDIDAASFKSYTLMAPGDLPSIRQNHVLKGQGWVEYEFSVPETGWYEILFQGHASVGDHDFFIDHNIHVYGGITDKITNAWLTAGTHTLRVQHAAEPGLAALKGFTIRRAGSGLDASARVEVVSDSMVLRKGESLLLDIYGGGTATPQTLTIWTKDTNTNATIATQKVDLPASSGLTRTRVAIPCPAEGIYYLSFGNGDTPIRPTDLRELQYVVVDTTPAAQTTGEIKKTLIREIDCTQTPPAQGFYSRGETRVVKTPFGSYRESGDKGYLESQEDYSFFAYDLDIDEPQRPYVIEVDYPDDAYRTFCIGLEERNMMDYPPVGGVDSGDTYSLTHRMYTQTFLHWPRGKEQRILIVNAQNGRRAAISKIRLYRVDGDLPALNLSVKNGRSFGYWLEEGDRWATFQGAPDKSMGGYLISMKRWAEASAYMGANTLSPTIAIYQNTLYPTKFYDGYFHPAAGPRDPMTLDVIRMLLLVCEKYGMKLLPDFQPSWNRYKRLVTDDGKYAKFPDPKPHLLVSKDGTTGTGNTDPYFNPLYPANKDWFIGMLGEFADRYKDSPALDGVSLRISLWVSETHNFIPSLNWGYEDYTVNLFQKETGIKVPVADDDPQRFHKRYDWLTTHAKDRWIQWRCEKIADLYRDIVARVREARPDLLVVGPFHGPQMDYRYYPGNDFEHKIERDGLVESLREGGFDPTLMGKIDGFCFLNTFHYYGRRSHNELSEQIGRDNLLDPELRTALLGPTGRSGVEFSNSYFEADEHIIPEQFGLAGVKPLGFVGVVNPAGRHYLERYALSLADADASIIIDGGEGYLLGQAEYLHEFLSEYRELPVARFTPRPDGRDPVAVWELKQPNDYYFYAVNRERFPVQVDLQLKGEGTVTRLSTGEAAPLNGNSMHLDLLPYQLMAFKAPADVSIASIKTTVPEEELKKVTAMVDWLSQLADDATQKKPGTEAVGDSLDILQKMTAEAKESLAQGHVWRARTLMENHRLRIIYDQIFRYPPYLRDLKAPVVPAVAMVPADLQKIAQASDGGAVEIWPSDSVDETWTGDTLLGTQAPQLNLSIDIPVANRYHFTLGYASGGDFGPLDLSMGDKPLGIATDERTDPHGAVTYSPEIVLAPGTQTLRLDRKSGTKTAISFLAVVPIYHDIVNKDWSVVGPFPSLSETKVPGDGLAKAYAPEVKVDLSAPVPLEDNGKTASWKSLEGDADYMNLYDVYHLYGTGITYAVTYIYAPSERKAQLSYGMDFWAKVWFNGSLVKDLTVRTTAPSKGQFTDEVDLKQGWNELLVKVESGGSGNGFWMAVSDPGDLRFAPRPEESPAH